MKIIINTTVLVKGGGIQVAKSIIEELRHNPENQYYVFLSPFLKKELKHIDFDDNFKFYSFPISPSKVLTRKSIKRRFYELETKIKPDLVFTVFGPSYWKPKSIHICGFADGWCYNPGTIAFSNLTFFEKLKKKLLIRYKNYHIKKTTDHLIVETNVAKKNIINFLNYPSLHIHVIGNTSSAVYDAYTPKSVYNNTYNLFTLSAYYDSKNLNIINKVSNILKEKSTNPFKFFLTIKDEVFKKKFENNNSVINLGPQSIENGPKLYDKYDALFLPTLLETFSASYPEAMKMKKPIITSNLDFAVDVCCNAAIYFDPLDPNDIAEKIIQAFSYETRSKLIKNGQSRLLEFETSKSRKDKYLKVFNHLLNLK
jgi:glycosyltransferase involved in cell wall biosynthesis